MQQLLERIRSPKFFWIVVGLFIVQGVFFTLAVDPSHQNIKEDGYVTRGGGVVPDGNRHLGAIYYFAKRPVLSTPYINDIEPRDIWMGEIQRFPSYLYYYTMSWPTRAVLSVGASDTFIVLMVRLLGVLMGVGVLLVIRRILNTAQDSQVITNLSVLAMSFTGAFVWMAAAENYDIMSLLLFLLFIYASVKLFIKQDTTQLLWMALWAFMVSITKYTYTPFVAVLSLVAVAMMVHQAGGVAVAWQLARQQYSDKFRVGPIKTGLLVVAIVIFGFLSVERLGINLVKYGQPDPNCDLIHETEDCMRFGVFARNHNRSIQYAEQIASGEVEPTTWRPIDDTAYWIWRYYSSIYGYVGHIWIYDFWPVMLVGGGVMLAVIMALIVFWSRRRPKILYNKTLRYLMLAAGLVILVQYLFNMNIIITYGGRAYGYQGRYLLSVLPFLYMWILLLAANLWRSLRPERKKYFIPLIAIVLMVGVVHSSVVSFFIHATSDDWYSELWLRLIS